MVKSSPNSPAKSLFVLLLGLLVVHTHEGRSTKGHLHNAAQGSQSIKKKTSRTRMFPDDEPCDTLSFQITYGGKGDNQFLEMKSRTAIDGCQARYAGIRYNIERYSTG